MSDPIDAEDTSLDEVLSLGADQETGVVYLFGDLSIESVGEVIPKLSFLAAHHERLLLHVASPGGSDAALMMLADTILGLPVPVDLYAVGVCSSAATILFAVCDHRTVGPYCEAVFHAFYCTMDQGEVLTHRWHVEAAQRTQEYAHRWAGEVARRTEALTHDALVDIALDRAPELRLTGQALVEHGLADEVLHRARTPRGATPDAQLTLPLGDAVTR